MELLDNTIYASRLGRKWIDEQFERLGITLEEIADITLASQQKYMPMLKQEHIVSIIDKVLNKDEAQDAIQLAIALDDLANKHLLPEPLNHKIVSDAGYFGLDELLVSAIYQLYGTVGVTNYGYIDKVKPSIIGEIDWRGKNTEVTTTFLDDVVGALAGGACGYFAHHQYEFYPEEDKLRGLNEPLPEQEIEE